VFGNPPYQEQTDQQKQRGEDDTKKGKQQAKPLYHKFVEAVIDCLSPRYFSLIIPSRWMAGGMGLDKFRARMMKDKHLRSIKHFPGSREVFKEVNIEFGVNYFLWDRDYQGKCDFNGKHRHLDEYDIILSDNEAVSILDKVLAVHGSNPWVSSSVRPLSYFGLATNHSNWVDQGVPCYTQGRTVKQVAPAGFSDKDGILGKWKVVTSEGRGEGNTQRDAEGRTRVISTIFQIEPGAICTFTYVVLGAFDTKEEADNFQSYILTKFFRFMLSLRLTGQHVNKEKFSWVPDLGSYTVAPTDEELFKMFGLTQEEVKYINSRIK
jgi:site-specific DNA-methyltransferase (adenine-specific)